MKYLLYTINLFLLLQLCCCRESGYRSAEKVKFTHFNDSIRKGTLADEAWVENPESISKHFFPSQTLPQGNREYSIQIERSEETSCEVIITDEGLRGDDVSLGEKWIATFEKDESSWQFTSLRKSVKEQF